MNTVELTQHISDLVSQATSPDDMMAIYAAMSNQMKVIEQALTQHSEKLGHGFTAHGVHVIYKTPKPTYDYRKAATRHFEALGMEDGDIEEMMLDNTKKSTDWKRITTVINAPLADFQKPMKSPVTIKVE